MGEGNLQQLIVFVLVTVFGLVELAARWFRRRSGELRPDDQPSAPFDQSEREEFAVPRSAQQPVRRTAPQSAPEPAPQSVARDTIGSNRSAPAERDRARKMRERQLRDRLDKAREATIRVAPARRVSSRAASQGMTASERSGGTATVTRRRPVFTADDARRAIIAQAVLGPCRGLASY